MLDSSRFATPGLRGRLPCPSGILSEARQPARPAISRSTQPSISRAVRSSPARADFESAGEQAAGDQRLAQGDCAGRWQKGVRAPGQRRNPARRRVQAFKLAGTALRRLRDAVQVPPLEIPPSCEHVDLEDRRRPEWGHAIERAGKHALKVKLLK
jgi:hypothetical protein